MRQLTGLDATYLALDSATVVSHLGCVCVIDPASRGEVLSLQSLTELVESKLDLLPPFRQRLAEVPLGLDQPYWIEDRHFTIDSHVREWVLPAPGGDHELAEQAARLHEKPLDRARPLWEMHLIHGLAAGKQAVYIKVHHAAIDGVAGTNLLGALLDPAPRPVSMPTVPAWRPDAEPTRMRLLARSVASAARQPIRLTRLSVDLLRLARVLANSHARPQLPVIDRLFRCRMPEATQLGTPLLAPRTPFNTMLGPGRRWAFGSLPIRSVQQIRDRAGGTVNDVVMALCAGALREWLADHGALPAGPLLAGVPVSCRTDQHTATHGNTLSKIVAPLPTHLSEPAERLRAVRTAMDAAKDQFHSAPTDVLTAIAACAVPAVANRVSRLANRIRLLERLRPLNLFISNVPGPPVRMYLGGAYVDAVYPLSTIADGQGLNITVMGSQGTLTFGILADPEQVPDVGAIRDGLVSELALLYEAVVGTTADLQRHECPA